MTFSIRATHNGRHSWLAQGDKIDLEFEDGKGVSGRIGDVSIEPGGSSFAIIVTHDGQWPEARPDPLNWNLALADVCKCPQLVCRHNGQPLTRPCAQTPDASPETACDAPEQGDGSNDPTPGQRDLLNALRLKSQLAEDLDHKVEALIRENLRLGRDRDGLQRLLDSRTRQLERSRHVSDERSRQLAKSADRIRELEASLKDLGNDYQLVREQLEQEKASRAEWERNSRNWEAQYQTLSEMTQKPKQEKAGAVWELPGGTINFYGEPSTQQVLGARERAHQRVVTMHEADGSVTIHVEPRGI